jgi:lipopolysaccharide/colanic/teichoic acid biosynthesis glycosyltransferase
MAIAPQDLLLRENQLPIVQQCIGRRWERIKVFMDYLTALLVVVGSMPFVLLAMALVRVTSRGPVIYSQRRLGRHGRIFTIYKIRTMYQNSEPNGPRWSVPGDPRITPVGRLLRWSHLD